MPNPFDTLGKTTEPELDQWGGAFSCQERDCWGVASIADYNPRERTLTWTPECGHLSKLVDVNE